jgi:broad specificity phosphatase PhoE
MTTLFLIRHGENDFVGKRLAGRLSGVHLNEKGRQQAEDIERMLRGRLLKGLYSSPLERTVETAQPLAKALNLIITLHPALQEVDFGCWQGKEISILRRSKEWKVVHETPSQMSFPQGESFIDAQLRIVAGLDEIAALHKDNDEVACFSHCDAIRLAMIHYLGMPLDSLHRLSIDTASLSILRLVKDGPPKIMGINMRQINSL